MKPLTQRQVSLIVGSLRRVFSTGNIEHLTKPAYNFIMLSSGFIAHYNLYGFRDEYQSVARFRQEILANRPNNQWNNFWSGDQHYGYYMQKRDVYNKICEAALTV